MLEFDTDAFGNSLIIQFLYHANMTEQVYANAAPAAPALNGANVSAALPAATNQTEFKSKRIQILRVLAIKTACLLKWNLLKFEKE